MTLNSLAYLVHANHYRLQLIQFVLAGVAPFQNTPCRTAPQKLRHSLRCRVSFVFVEAAIHGLLPRLAFTAKRASNVKFRNFVPVVELPIAYRSPPWYRSDSSTHFSWVVRADSIL